MRNIIMVFMALLLFDTNSQVGELKEEVRDLKYIVSEQQAFINNQRNVDKDIWDMLNLHSESLNALWVD